MNAVAKVAPAKETPAAVVNIAHLKSAVMAADWVVETRKAVPVLGNLLLSQAGKRLVVSATDLDMMVRISLPLSGRIDSFMVPSATLKKIVQKAPAEADVSIGAFQERIPISIGPKIQLSLTVEPPEEFPDLAIDNDRQLFSMRSMEFLRAISNVRHAVSDEETRYYLNGIFIHASDRHLHFVATDGHRLLKQDMTLPVGAKNMPPMIVPKKTIDFLIRFLKGAAEDSSIVIGCTESMVSFDFDDISIVSKLIDGTFPDYNRVIPAETDIPAVFRADQLLMAIDHATMLSSERGRAVAIRLEVNKCCVEGNNPETGSVTVDLECFYNGEWMRAGYNSVYIKQMASTLCKAGGDVRMFISEVNAPARLIGSEPGLVGVLMPMRI